MSASTRRRLLSWCLSTALTLSALPAVAVNQASPVASSAGSAVQHEMTNGLRIVLLEDHSFPLVSCFMWYRTGSRNELPGTTGVGHVLEHLLFQDITGYRKGEVGASIVRNGGQFNGYTSDDFIAFYQNVHPSKLDQAIKLEAARMHAASFEAADMKEEVERVEKELQKEEKDSAAVLSREVRAAAFQNHPYHNPVSGWPNDVENLTVKDVKAFYDRYFTPDNATIVLVGDFRAQDALTSITRHFGTIPKSGFAPHAVRAAESAQHAEREVSIKQAAKRDLGLVAYHAPPFNEPDAAAMFVLEKLLNTTSGRLKSRLIETKMCGSARCAFELKKDPGLFSVSLQPTAGTGLQKVLEVWDNIASQLRAQPVSDPELRRAKAQAEYSLENDCDGPYRMAFHLGFCDALGSWQTARKWIDEIRSVSSSDIMRVSKRYLLPENRVVGSLSATGGAKPAPQSPSSPGKAPTMRSPAADRFKSPSISYDSTLGHFRMFGFKTDEESAVASSEMVPDSNSASDADTANAGSAGNVEGTGSSNTMGAAGSSQAGASEGTGSKEGTDVKPGTDVKAGADVKEDTGATGTTTESTGHASNSSLDGATTPGTGSELPEAGRPGTESGSPLSPGRTETTRPSTGSTGTGHATAPGRAATSRPQANFASVRGPQRLVLPDGIVLYVLESHLSHIVHITGGIRAGTIFEPVAKRGVSSLLAACMNGGSSKISRAQALSMQEDLGLTPDAMLRFDSEPENITFDTRCLSKDVSRQLSLLAASIRDPSVSDSDVDRARLEVQASIKHNEELLSLKVERAFLRSLLAPSSGYYPCDPSELVKSTNNLKAQDLKQFQAESIAPEAITLVMAGDVDVAHATKLVEEAFAGFSHTSSFKAKVLPDAEPNPKKILKTVVPVHEKDASFLCVGRLLPVARSSGHYGELLMADAAILNHPIFARIIKRLNEDPSLLMDLTEEDVQTHFHPFSKSTAWSLHMPLQPNVVPRATSVVQTELKQLGQLGITAPELAEVKRYLLNGLPLREMPNTSGAAHSILDAALHGAEPNYMNIMLEEIRMSALDTINRFIKTDFKPDQCTVAVAGSKQSLKDQHAAPTITQNPGF